MSETERRGMELLDLMSDISEDCYCAGWLIGLEERLWSLIEDGGGHFGMCHFDAEDWKLMRLRELRDETGMWAHWTEDHGEQLIPIDEWRTIYDAKWGKP